MEEKSNKQVDVRPAEMTQNVRSIEESLCGVGKRIGGALKV